MPDTIKRILKNWKVHRNIEHFGLEEAIIVKLGHLNFLESIHKRKAPGYTQEKFINDISHCICYILNKCKERKATLYYKKIANEFFKDLPKGGNNRIITFNYDTMLDEHFYEKFQYQKLYFDAILDRKSENKRKRTIMENNPFMLKLHGSANWACYKDDFKKIHGGPFNCA